MWYHKTDFITIFTFCSSRTELKKNTKYERISSENIVLFTHFRLWVP